ncbi:MAG: MBL fold metallo-hydrolase [Nitrospirae bacterium]|nr:MBL fold metallo-hydrolase [Nitrospirota bacterium]
MKVLFLGSGTSTGVPVIGCKCDVCKSDDPRNKRTRSSILITAEIPLNPPFSKGEIRLPPLEKGGKGGFEREIPSDKYLLVDTTTDLRSQALANRVERVDAVLFTHAHADHIHGIDDLRSFNHIQGNPIPCYGGLDTMEVIRHKFSYIFDGSARRDWVPRLEVNIVDSEFSLYGLRILPLKIFHGESTILGFRINDVSYLTDCSGIPDDTKKLLIGTKLLILDATRYQPHAKHYGLAQAIDVIKELKPERALLTHLSHAFDHHKVNHELPSGIELAYDGMEISQG